MHIISCIVFFIKEKKVLQIILYILAIVLTIVSFIKDSKKTKLALIKAVKAFENILPTVLCVMEVVGITLSLIDEEIIVKLIGNDSGIIGLIISILLGSITMMGGFIAFPLGATLISKGASICNVAAFISSLMMVGILTFKMEEKYWGRKATLLRNALGIIVSIIVGIVMGMIYR